MANSELRSESIEFLKHCEIYKQIRAVIRGKYAVIDIVTCLPQPQYRDYSLVGANKEQMQHAAKCADLNSQRTRAYWARGRLLNATSRTSESLAGMVFSEMPVYELSPSLAYIEKNANGYGKSLNDLAGDVVEDVIALGRCGALVDMPVSDITPTIAEQETGALAPKICIYKAESIFYSRVDEYGVLQEVRLIEIRSIKKAATKYSYEDVKYLRRLVMQDGVYVNELYDENDKLQQVIAPKMNGAAMSFIPFYFFGSDSNDSEYSKPPLYDLANMNLGHFVHDCDNRSNTHDNAMGLTVVYTDMSVVEFEESNPNGLDFGAKGKNMLRQGDKVEILQIQQSSATRESMQDDVKSMIYMGAQLVQDVNTNVTLGAKEMEFGASISTLKRVSLNVSRGFDQLLNWCAMMLNDTQESTYKLNTKFITDAFTPQLLAVHMQMIQGGVLPSKTAFEAARKAGLTDLPDDELAEALLVETDVAQGESEELARLRAENDALRERNDG